MLNWTASANADPRLTFLAIALEEQLGLKREQSRESLKVLVIDSVSPPTQN